MPIEDLNNKVAVITGGCGQIGYAAARRLAERGVRIVSIVRRELESAQQMMSQLPNSQLDHFAVLASVSDTSAIKRVVEEVKTRAGRCDILINAAGISLPTNSPLDTTDEIFDQMIDVNLKGTWVVIREFFPLLNANKGLVINLSSVASLRPRPNSLAYSASKAAVNSMTECLAKSLGPNVRFAAIAPSALPNPTSGNIKMGPDRLNWFKDNIPLKRIGTAEDVADAIESLATSMKFFNGHLIRLDGGVAI